MKKPLIKKFKKIPKKPGAYLLKDKTGEILYIGKAQDIKKRIQSHFSKKKWFFHRSVRR
ncbi:GIY-YIG nuclease family protein [Patescibacteria group bacterium]|nr:GIY-YIG nuclease family protein [Patescibacteria group bacterium]